MLVEMLVAMAVAAFLLVALASVTSFVLRAHGRIAAQAADLDGATRILAGLSREIRTAAQVRWSGNKAGFVFAGSSNQILFAQDVPSGAGLDRTEVIRFDSEPSGGKARLLRSESVLAPDARSFESLVWASPQEVYGGRYRVAFAYFGALDVGEVLLDDWSPSDRMPVAVRVSLVPLTADETVLSLRVPLLIDGEPGCALPRDAPCGIREDAAGSDDAASSDEPVDADDAEGWVRYVP